MDILASLSSASGTDHCSAILALVRLQPQALWQHVGSLFTLSLTSQLALICAAISAAEFLMMLFA